jgi:hypothetical protein
MTGSNGFSIYVHPQFFAKAACRGLPTEWWFPPQGPNKEQLMNLRKAREICSGCVVRAECEEYGRRTGSDGVWGGVSLSRGQDSARGKKG